MRYNFVQKTNFKNGVLKFVFCSPTRSALLCSTLECVLILNLCLGKLYKLLSPKKQIIICHRFQFHFCSLTVEYIFGKRLPKVEIPISTTFHRRGAYRRINNHQQENAEYCGLHNYKVFQHVMRISTSFTQQWIARVLPNQQFDTFYAAGFFGPLEKKSMTKDLKGRDNTAQSSSKKINVLAILGEGSTKTVQI